MKVNRSEGLRLSGQITLTQPRFVCGMTKLILISKQMVSSSYLQVKFKGGGSGIDGETIKDFDKFMSKGLYKLWNRLSSGRDGTYNKETRWGTTVKDTNCK